MQETDLPYPGVINSGLALRRECVKAISGIQTSVGPAGKHAEADNLKAFFQACADFLTPFVAGSDPVNTVAPVLSGTPTVGQTLTVTTGTWTGTPTPTYKVQWFRDGEAIGGATAGTYVLKADDVGKRLTARVTASSAGGRGEKLSNPSGKVVAA